MWSKRLLLLASRLRFSTVAKPNYTFQYGNAMKPHTAKQDKGGQDAFYVSDNILVVCDGVGGWSNQGIDPGLYSKRLCKIIEELVKKDFENYVNDPVKLLTDAVDKNKQTGSTTACIATLNPQTGKLLMYYIGDSVYGLFSKQGVQMAPQQQFSFNFPYQIGTGGNDPSQGVLHQYQYDKIIDKYLLIGSDGIWDNMKLDLAHYLVFNEDKQNNTLMTKAQNLVLYANHLSLQQNYQSPFYLKAKQAKIRMPKEGKHDDVTVILAKIKKHQYL